MGDVVRTFSGIFRFKVAHILQIRFLGYFFRKTNLFGAHHKSKNLLSLRNFSLLGRRGDEIHISEDLVIFEQTRLNGNWALEEVEFILRQAVNGSVLLDLGANAGLVSLQVMHMSGRRISAVCVEPIPRNFNFIEHNLRHYVHETYQFALGKRQELSEFYVRHTNFGNSSAVKSNLRGEFDTINVKFEHPSILDESPLIRNTLSVILKSDLEGMDISVIARFSRSLWEKINAGVIEIWPNGNLELEDIEAFVEGLSVFAWKSWDPRGHVPIGNDELLNYLLLGSSEIKSLYFKRL